jgi:diguanylate cyclase (GGDEF)-like protein/PAS domain S-box-containing protein
MLAVAIQSIVMEVGYNYYQMETGNYTPSASFMDLLVDAVCAVDGDGRFMFVSAACERIFGYTPEEMVGTLMIDMVAPEDRARTLSRVDEIMAGVASPHFENRYVRKDGSRVHIMWSARWSESDQLRIAVARDVTERHRAESMKAAMYAISEAAHAAGDLLALFPLIHRIVNELLPAPGFAIALHDDATGQVNFPYNVGANGQPSGSRLPGAATLCQHVMRSGQPMLVTPDTLATFPQALRAAAGDVAPYWLGVPLSSRNGVLGALVLKGAPELARYSEQDQELLQFVSAQVATAIERKQLHDQLQFLAQYDALTRLPNRQLLHDRLESTLARARRGATGFSLLYLDLDKFKQVNDRFGHAAGDRLLQEVANRISHCIREADTVARIGGDEFVVLLEHVVLADDAALVADKIRDALTQPVIIGEHVVQTCPSIGTAMYPEHGDSAHQLLKHADEAMYLAKKRRANGERHFAGSNHAAEATEVRDARQS